MASGYAILGGVSEDPIALLVQLRGARDGLASAGIKFLPGTAHQKAAQIMREELAKKGIDADVTAISTLPPGGPIPKRDFLTGIAIGAVGGVGLAVGAKFLWTHVLSRLIA